MGNLTENDFQRVADLLGIEVAVVKAVQAVETGGSWGLCGAGAADDLIRRSHLLA